MKGKERKGEKGKANKKMKTELLQMERNKELKGTRRGKGVENGKKN